MVAHARTRFGAHQVKTPSDDGRSLRTDLALEAQQSALASAREKRLPGVHSDEEHLPFGTLSRLNIESDIGAQLMGKPIGSYSTLQVPQLQERRRELARDVSECLAQEIDVFLEKVGVSPEGVVLVVGLGNWNATPDNIGPLTTSKLLVTRHLHEYNVLDEESLGQLRPVAALSPGVLGLTGVETAEIVQGVVERIQPDCVICVDALAARSIERLGTTFQLADVGIDPGSGVGNRRMSLTEESLGVPVLALGCPTVIYATTIVNEAVDRLAQHAPGTGSALQPDVSAETLSQGGQSILDPSRIVVHAREEFADGASFLFDPHVRQSLVQEVLGPSMGRLVVTPKEVDLLVETLSDILADALNEALHPGISAEEAALLR